MRIISEKKLRRFWEKHKEAEPPMRAWIKIVRKQIWNDFTDVRKTFNHTDIYGSCTIFDVGGNKYRIIAKTAYGIKVIYIRYVLTHTEYDERKWQSDCS